MHVLTGLIGMVLLVLSGLVMMLGLAMTVLWQVRCVVRMSREITQEPSPERPRFSWQDEG